MSIKIGNNDISKIYLGSTEIEKIYQGDTAIYEGDEPTPPTPPSPSYDTQYLTFEALESGTFSFSGVSSASANTLQYSVDSGTTWTTIGTNTNTPTVQSGKKIMWKGSNLIIDYNGPIHFMSSGNFNVEGNVMSLVNGDDFATATTISNNNQFYFLFRNCAKLISAENMVLPATTLADGCYRSMFSSCSSLTTAPELPATTLANNCYVGMFSYCTSLTTAPELPATTLTNYCYQNMFADCTSLTTAPVLSATTLTESCYYAMFEGCTSLTAITCLATDISASDCTYYWVNGVAQYGEFTGDANMSDWCYGENGVPSDWTMVQGQAQECGGGYLQIELNDVSDIEQWCGVVLPQYLIGADNFRNALFLSDIPCGYGAGDADVFARNFPVDLGSYRYLSLSQSDIRRYPLTLYFSDDPNAQPY